MTGRRDQVEDAYPLSPLQAGILYHSLCDPDYEVYSVQLACRLSDLDTLRWRASWDEVVARHAALRTAFAWKNLREPCQLVGRQVTLPWRELDWGRLDKGVFETRFQALLEQDRQEGYNLAHAPLMRLWLIRCGVETVWFLWSYHHIILDAWSSSQVLTQVLAAYERRGGSPGADTLPPAPGFRGYVDWLCCRDREATDRFWRTALEGFTRATPLVVDRPASPDAPPAFGQVTAALSPRDTSRLVKAGQANGLTLNALLQGAWALVLHRTSGEQDVLFGATEAGRPPELPDVEAIVGLFINTLAVRVRIDRAASLAEWLTRLQDQQVAAREHAWSSLVDVQGGSAIPRGQPLFETILIVENLPQSLGVSEASVRIEERRADWLTNYPLSVMVVPGDSMRIQLRFDRRRLEEEAVAGFANLLRGLLVAFATDLDRVVGEVDGLDGLAHAQPSLQGRAAPQLAEGFLTAMVAAQAELTPHAPAVRSGAERFDYASLWERVESLAGGLRALDLPRGAVVAVLLDRSPVLVAALLAVLEAGAAYLPLDPTHPPGRLADLLEDAQPALVLTAGDPPPGLSRLAPILQLAELEAHKPGAPALALDPEDLAFLIYTSGSSGRPKGVRVPQRALTHLLRSVTELLGFDARARILAVSSVAFDIAALELFLPLTVGGEVVVADSETTADGFALARCLDEIVPSHVQATPSTWRLLLDAGWGGAPALTVLCGGEPLPRALADALQERAGDVWNLYGPTETTIWSTAGLVPPVGPVTIGAPLPNTRLRCLDRWGNPVLFGFPGEVWIGGLGVASGYHRRPNETAAAFAPDPSGASGDVRFYRTGDRGRLLSDGSLELLGREDDQVKIRGVRVELAEVEAVLVAHPYVSQAAVILAADGLAGFVVGRGGDLSMGALRTYLKGRLPAAFVPIRFQAMAALPLTPNGKLDRRALERLPRRPQVTHTHRAPRNPSEEILAAQWADALGVERVGVHDNLFELGGHSLLVTRLVALANRRFGISLPLHSLVEEPTVAAFAVRVEVAIAGGPMTPVVPVPRVGSFPLSFAQQGLWFMAQLESGSYPLAVSAAVRLSGSLQLDVLEAALQELVARHEALRTRFPIEEGEPRQLVEAAHPLALEIRDVQDRQPEEARRSAARRLLAETAGLPFDLATGPLVRVLLVREAPEEAILLLVVHHVIADGWSLTVLLRELATLYPAYVEGVPSPLPPPVLHHVDYTVWQRAQPFRLDPARLGQLRAVTPLRPFPHRPRAARPSYECASHCLQLSLDELQAAEGLARRESVTLFVVLESALKVVLSRFSGQERLVVGTPLASRVDDALDGCVGPLVNTVVLFSDLEDNPSFEQLLQWEQRELFAALGQPPLPFAKLVEALDPPREVGEMPLIQVLVVLENTPPPPRRFGAVQVTPARVDEGEIGFELELELHTDAEGLTVRLFYRTELATADDAARLCDAFRHVLGEAVIDPERRVRELPLVPPETLRRQLEVWNPVTPAPALATLDVEVAARAQVAPDAVAYWFEGEALCYADLEKGANQLAHHLLVGYAALGDVVAVCLRPGLLLPQAVLGVLKAGCTYMPLDPDLPPRLQRELLADARATCILHVGSSPPATPGVRGVALDREREAIAARPSTPPAVVADTERPAYLLYTSGSTGRPQGVLGLHRGAVHRCGWMEQAYSFEPGERTCLSAPLGFVDAVWGLFGGALAGVPTVIAPAAAIADPARLLRLLVEERVTRVALVPSVLSALLAVAEEQGVQPSGVRLWISSGEPLTKSLVERLRSLLPEARLLNLYGTTEVAADCCHHLVRGDELSVPLGRPLAHTRVYVIDRGGRLAPPGALGEVCVAGVGLAAGYHGLPRQTAAAFPTLTLGSDRRERVFRTGDLGVWLSDGTLIFCGRRDAQLKLRGQRLEPRQIEAALEDAPTVRQAAVTTSGVGMAIRLVAFVVLEPDATLDAESLREHLRARLPFGQIPAEITALRMLPRTSSGKLVRRELPALPARPAGRPPATELERQLAVMWGAVLGEEPQDVEAEFFSLGGHSLMAALLVSRIERALDIEIGLPAFLAAPTIRQLAEYVDQSSDRVASLSPAKRQLLLRALRAKRSGRSALRRRARDGPVPQSFAQQRLWFLDRLQPNDAFYNMPESGRLRGQLQVGLLRRCLNTIVCRHEALRTTFANHEGQPVQIIASRLELEVPLESFETLPAHDRLSAARSRIAEEANRPFDLARGPLIRLHLFRLSPDDHLFLLNTHHIISDGWSVGVLIWELNQLYACFAAGRPADLDPLPVQYADFALWQREWLQGERLQRQLDYWRQTLSEIEQLRLPVDRARPTRLDNAGDSCHLRLEPDVVEQLEALARCEQATLFMLLSLTFKVLLHRYSGQTDLALGTPVASRSMPELEPLVGFFANTLVLRTNLSGNPSFREALSREREVALGAFSHADVPFERLVAELAPSRDPNHNPLFGVMLILQNTPPQRIQLPELSLELFEAGVFSVKFDLLFELYVVDGVLEGWLGFRHELFERSTVEGLVEDYLLLLRAGVADPDLALSDLPLRPPGADLVSSFNDDLEV